MASLNSVIEEVRTELINRQHRKLVVLDGSQVWQVSVLTELLDCYQKSEHFTCASWGEIENFSKFKISNFRQQLGKENDLVIFHEEEFHSDAFAALSGTLKAGGLMVWLPTENQTRDTSNLFIRRFWQKILLDDEVTLFTENSTNLLKSVNAQVSLQITNEILPYGCITQEQVTAVNAIVKVVTGHRNRPLVLTADRGRGKTSALAIAVNHLIQDDKNAAKNFVICAPSMLAIEVFFKQLQHSCPTGERVANDFTYHENTVSFLPIDQLLSQKPKVHLLLIDEAAALPLHLLMQVVGHYHRVVFSSTQHGYEGAGRGFAIKFKHYLEERVPDYQTLHLNQPIRWRDNDPLERFTFEAFLFSCITETKFNSLIKVNELFSREVSQQELFANEQLLTTVFSTLVSAHYQTSPTDLKMLLDNPSIKLIVSFTSEEELAVVAVALIIEEGHASPDAIKQMQQSKVQLKNQFTPQFLARHCLYPQAFESRYWRVVRIAVADELQQKGVGQQLMAYIKRQAEINAIDFISTSFAATADVLSFWQKLKFNIIRLGVTPDKASGEYSAIMLHAISHEGFNVINELQTSFYPALFSLMPEHYQFVPTELVKRMIISWPKSMLPDINDFDRKAVTAFIEQHAQFSTAMFSLQKWLVNRLKQSSGLKEDLTTQQAQALLISVLLQRQPLEHICQQFNFTGRKQWLAALRKAVARINSD